jgi:flagellar protein FliL
MAAITEPGADEPAEATPASPGRRRLIWLLVPGVPALAAAMLAGLWYGGVLPPLFGMGAKAVGHGGSGAHAGANDSALGDAGYAPPLFVEVPELVANLNAGANRRNVFIKLRARLEVAKPEEQAIVTAAMPRLQDMFQTYLREMRPDELRGSAGTYRLREELVARANVAAAPARVLDVLFVEMLVQ